MNSRSRQRGIGRPGEQIVRPRRNLGRAFNPGRARHRLDDPGLLNEELDAFAQLLDSDDPGIFALDVLYRAALESGSLALWLLEAGIGHRRRVARGFVYRLSGAHWVEAALEKIELEPGDLREEYGELTPAVLEEACGLGLSIPEGGRRADRFEGETFHGYLERAEQLTRHYSSTPSTPYQVYSGALHAELWGLWRGFCLLDRGDHPHELLETVHGDFAIHSTTQGILGAAIIPGARAASYLGANGLVDEFDSWARHLDLRIPELGPPP